jgi:LacI family transcriptional regulator
MPPLKIHSMRALAREIGVSLATVSDSLRGDPRVNAQTSARVRLAAAELGYVYNPLAGSVMSEIRRSSVSTFRGLTAIVDLEASWARPARSAIYHQMLTDGARETAQRLGFKVDYFNTAESGLPLRRLNSVLKSRGISAILLLPMFARPVATALDWERFTGVYADYLIDDPPLNRVFPDHFRSMFIALESLLAMGYKRPGLVLHQRHAERMLYRFESAFDSFWAHHAGGSMPPHLIFEDLKREAFLKWFRASKPDVVIAHPAEIVDWMTEVGCRVPETHGFCSLNVLTAGRPVAGLDLMPALAGQRAMEILVAQIQRNERGTPKFPLLASYDGAWQDGPTLRMQDGTGSRAAGKVGQRRGVAAKKRSRP